MGIEIIQNEPVRDEAKRTLTIAKFLAKCICAYPSNRTVSANIVIGIIISITFLFTIGQMVFFIQNIYHFPNLVACMITLSPSVQTLVKLAVFVRNSDSLAVMLNLIWYRFWPANLMGVKSKKAITFQSNCFIAYNVIMLTTGTLAVTFIAIGPLLAKNKTLPFPAAYPIDWTRTPFYEILYLLEWGHGYICVITACAFDFLLTGICHNIVMQIEILQQVFANLGTANAQKINERLEEYAIKYRNFVKYDGDNSSQLLKRCAIHHELLARIIKELGEIFSLVCLVQLVCSASGLCVIYLAISTTSANVSMTLVTAYIVVHVSELFLICFYGSEISSRSGALSNHIYGSKWYNLEPKVLKGNMIFVMIRMQKEMKLSAAGFADVGLILFVKVIRFTFSVYTMLSPKEENNFM